MPVINLLPLNSKLSFTDQSWKLSACRQTLQTDAMFSLVSRGRWRGITEELLPLVPVLSFLFCFGGTGDSGMGVGHSVALSSKFCDTKGLLLVTQFTVPCLPAASYWLINQL